MTRIRVISFFTFLCLAIPIVAEMPQEKVDLDAIYKIKDEGLNRSQVMDTLSYLTDVYGARLTGSDLPVFHFRVLVLDFISNILHRSRFNI